MTLKIIGAGPTAILTAYFLKNKFKFPKNIQIFERNNFPGGRMASCPLIYQNQKFHIDLGMQYISVKIPELTKIQSEILNLLETNHALHRFELKKSAKEPPYPAFQCDYRLRSVKNHDIFEFLIGQTENLEIFYGNSVRELDTFIDQDQIGVSTIPIPNLLAISGSDQLEISKPVISTKYHFRYCLAMLLPRANFKNFEEYRFYHRKEAQFIRYIRFIEYPNYPDLIGVSIHGNNSKFDSPASDADSYENLKQEFFRLQNLKNPESVPIYAEFLQKWEHSKPDHSQVANQHFSQISDNFYLAGDLFSKEANFLNLIDSCYLLAEEINSRFV